MCWELIGLVEGGGSECVGEELLHSPSTALRCRVLGGEL